MTWTCGKFEIDLASTRVMGIVNVTPDSFSDGGLYLRPGDAVAHARALVKDGADVIDVGAESTRPGHRPLPASAEWARLEPALRQILLGYGKAVVGGVHGFQTRAGALTDTVFSSRHQDTPGFSGSAAHTSA